MCAATRLRDSAAPATWASSTNPRPSRQTIPWPWRKRGLLLGRSTRTTTRSLHAALTPFSTSSHCPLALLLFLQTLTVWPLSLPSHPSPRRISCTPATTRKSSARTAGAITSESQMRGLSQRFLPLRLERTRKIPLRKKSHALMHFVNKSAEKKFEALFRFSPIFVSTAHYNLWQ